MVGWSEDATNSGEIKLGRAIMGVDLFSCLAVALTWSKEVSWKTHAHQKPGALCINRRGWSVVDGP